MELFDVMRTTFAARDFTSDPVPDEVLYRILDNARFAPSGGNRQGWKVLVIREDATREALFRLMMPTFRRYYAQSRAGEAPLNTIHPTALTDEEIAATEPPEDFIRRIADAPVVLLVLVDLSVVASMDAALPRVGVISGASIYPFVHNILLAARHEGLGGTPTTFVAAQEDELKALLGIPDHLAVASLIPMGRPVKQLTRLKRRPVEEFAMLERWGGPPLTGG
ncbi:MAG: nitroreductase [Gammaproteobacteria bacterium]|nr:nitroreductase [Gammaproteobacteria bacterium]|tara:strand:- start:550 stop:1218 length:669 start_codon:yes stop_codon:yes gene_type:complete